MKLVVGVISDNDFVQEVKSLERKLALTPEEKVIWDEIEEVKFKPALGITFTEYCFRKRKDRNRYMYRPNFILKDIDMPPKKKESVVKIEKVKTITEVKKKTITKKAKKPAPKKNDVVLKELKTAERELKAFLKSVKNSKEEVNFLIDKMRIISENLKIGVM